MFDVSITLVDLATLRVINYSFLERQELATLITFDWNVTQDVEQEET